MEDLQRPSDPLVTAIGAKSDVLIELKQYAIKNIQRDIAPCYKVLPVGGSTAMRLYCESVTKLAPLIAFCAAAVKLKGRSSTSQMSCRLPIACELSAHYSCLGVKCAAAAAFPLHSCRIR